MFVEIEVKEYKEIENIFDRYYSVRHGAVTRYDAFTMGAVTGATCERMPLLTGAMRRAVGGGGVHERRETLGSGGGVGGLDCAGRARFGMLMMPSVGA